MQLLSSTGDLNETRKEGKGGYITLRKTEMSCDVFAFSRLDRESCLAKGDRGSIVRKGNWTERRKDRSLVLDGM